MTFGPNGLSSLRYGGREFLKSGDFRVFDALLETPEGETDHPPLQSGKRIVDAARHRVTWRYSWGEASCEYRALGNRLDLALRATNRSGETLRGVSLQLMELRFPSPPEDWPDGWPRLGHNLGAPTLLPVRFDGGTLLVANEEIGRPLLVGFPGGPSRTERPLRVSTYNAERWLSPYLDPYLNRPIPPGGSDAFHLSVRFGPAGATSAALAPDVIARFRAAYPYRLKWSDRRPIGALFLSSAPPHPANDPRGWFNNEASVDVTTEAGRARFREELSRYADESIRILKEMDAQGMIAWDIEGQEHPHAMSYIGDPRSLPPEIEPAIDAFFRKFRDAGLRVGVTLRPQLPLRRAYDERIDQYEVPDPAAVLIEKIGYARKRWGCTLFYVDSNGDPNVPLPAEVFGKAAKAFPDVLLIPEHENPRYYAVAAPFHSFEHEERAYTPDDVRAIYPQAFSVIYAPDGPLKEKRRELVEAARRGDILLFHGWWPNPNNAFLKGVVEEARRER
jgi:hypothetical protein